jgi:integrator complex subunit 9
MKVICLNGDPSCPCFVLTAKGCTIMLDCAMNLKTLQYFLPQLAVLNQRFENMPVFRTQSGQIIENLKELNNRFFLNSTLEFSMPEFDLINIEDLDAVLISNYNSMLALPYLTKLAGFRATIYCTEPVMHFGRILMDELVHYVKINQPSVKDLNVDQAKSDLNKCHLFNALSHLAIDLNANKDEEKENQKSDEEMECSAPPLKQAKLNGNLENGSKLEKNLNHYYNQLAHIFNINETHLKPVNWKFLYSKTDIDLCMSSIKLVCFDERLDIYGSLTIQPKSAGYSLGSCNWVIEADNDTISYLSRSSILSTHSKLFDQSFFKQQNIDCLIVSGLNQANMKEPEQRVQDFCKACLITLKNKGNVLVPTLPVGNVFDLIECLYHFLVDASMHSVPIYFISKMANQSFAYSNIFAEWLCDSKQNLVYAAESPFQHAELIKNGKIRVLDSLSPNFNDELVQPCIIFASHPSLRFGEACQFVELWKNSPLNSFIFTDPDYFHLEALCPYQPVYANYYYFPIDISLNSNQMYKILNESKQITQLITSAQYKLDPNELQADNCCKIDQSKLNPNMIVNYYSQNDIIKLALKRKYENCDIETELASMIMINMNKEVGNTNTNKIAFATINAQLVTKNNHHILRATTRTIPLNRRDRLNQSNLKKYVYGKLNLDRFIMILRQSGFNNLKITEKERSEQEGSELLMSSLDKDTLLVDDSVLFCNRYLIEIDEQNKVEVDINLNKINVMCENDDIRVKIKDSLLKCLKAL